MCLGCHCTALAFSTREPARLDRELPSGMGGGGNGLRGRLVSGVSSAASLACGRSNTGGAQSSLGVMRMRGEKGSAPDDPEAPPVGTPLALPPPPPLVALALLPLFPGAEVFPLAKTAAVGNSGCDPFRGGTIGGQQLGDSLRALEFLRRGGGAGGRDTMEPAVMVVLAQVAVLVVELADDLSIWLAASGSGEDSLSLVAMMLVVVAAWFLRVGDPGTAIARGGGRGSGVWAVGG